METAKTLILEFLKENISLSEFKDQFVTHYYQSDLVKNEEFRAPLETIIMALHMNENEDHEETILANVGEDQIRRICEEQLDELP